MSACLAVLFIRPSVRLSVSQSVCLFVCVCVAVAVRRCRSPSFAFRYSSSQSVSQSVTHTRTHARTRARTHSPTHSSLLRLSLLSLSLSFPLCCASVVTCLLSFVSVYPDVASALRRDRRTAVHAMFRQTQLERASTDRGRKD